MAFTGGRVWGPIALGALVVVAGALVFLALRPPEPPPPTIAVSDPESTETAQPAADGSSPQATPETPTPDVVEPDATAVGRERPLDVLSSRVAVRGTAGACPGGGASIEVSDDQGRSWSALSTPTDALLRLNLTSEQSMWFVGAAGEDCPTGFTSTEDLGGTWVGPGDTTGAWHLLLEEQADRVHAPFGDVDSPCAPVSTVALEALSFEQASVLCGDGGVFSTVNGGVSWDETGREPNSVALGLLGEVPVVAVPTDGDCVGLSVTTVGDVPLGCIEGAPGNDVALAFNGAAAGWALAGDDTWTSNDGGATWTRRE